MAAFRLVLRRLKDISKYKDVSVRSFKSNKLSRAAFVACGSIAAGSVIYQLSLSKQLKVYAKSSKSTEEQQVAMLTPRERRFIRFASVEYDGQLYMSPQDFLESMTESEPRPRMKRRRLTKKDLDHIYDKTPNRNRGSTKLFRSLHETGIISYTEYLFLLSVLTKPHSGFQIAFNMFDTDGNEKVDKKEFLVVLHVLASSFFRRSAARMGYYAGVSPEILEKIFSTVARKGNVLRGATTTAEGKELTDDPQQPMNTVDTSLLVHLFGRKGNDELSYKDFYRFMDNLQTEVLELEFTEFSRGMPTISEVDFARILLRYTYVHSDDYEAYIQRVQERILDEKGITFEQFKAFCQFLNTLDDFAIAMRMFTFANQPISQEEFHRAVRICTGHSLDTNLVDTVFQIFDEDGDGHLSYKEFIAIMRDRIHRGFRSHLVKTEGWDAFKSCVKTEMKS